MRMKRLHIALLAGGLALSGCRELPAYFNGARPLARVGNATLYLHEAERAAPEGLSGDDSAAFYRSYVDRWIDRRLKLDEAERLFTETERNEVETKVEEYRQSLLIRQLDNYCIDRAIDTTFTDDEIETYYNSHLADFKSDRTLVKGRILCLPDGTRQGSKLLTLLQSADPARRKDLEDICTKHNYPLFNLDETWVDWEEFLSHLPARRDSDYSSLLSSSVLHQMRDNEAHYHFLLTSVRREGEALPLERVRETIRRILFNRRQNELLREAGEQRRAEAEAQERIKRYYDDDEDAAASDAAPEAEK